jgi:predicted DNA-binding protein
MLVHTGWRILAPLEANVQKTRLNIYLNQQQKEKLDKLSDKTGAPISELIRRAIDLYLKKEA